MTWLVSYLTFESFVYFFRKTVRPEDIAAQAEDGSPHEDAVPDIEAEGKFKHIPKQTKYYICYCNLTSAVQKMLIWR